MSASPEQNNSVQGILHDSLTSVGFEPVTLPVSDKNIIGSNLSKMDQNGSNIPSMSLLRREGSNMSVASLPATMKDGTQKPFFRSKIPTPTKSGQSTPYGSRTDLSKLRNLSSPPPIPPKPKLVNDSKQQTTGFQKVPLRREISLPPCLNERRGSVDSTAGGGRGNKSGRTTPTSGMRTRIPQLRASTEKLNNNSPTNNTVKGQIRKWESSASLTTGLEVSLRIFVFSLMFFFQGTVRVVTN